MSTPTTKTQERVVSQSSTAKRGAGTRGGTSATDADGAPEKKGKKKKLLILGLPLVLLAAAAAWFFLLRGDAAPAEKPAPVAGAVAPLDPISINLAGGKYLRLGLALQATDKAYEAPEGSKALDLAISTFSGLDVAVLADLAQRDVIKAELEHKVVEAYHEEVMAIYFTEFVTQ